MTVGELIETLKSLNPNMPVYLPNGPQEMVAVSEVSTITHFLGGTYVLLESMDSSIDIKLLPMGYEMRSVPTKGTN